MLIHLSVKNLALIDEINLDFDKGLNILTGETGAGKSIIIDAVNLALGERADRDLIQSGKEFARVEALFDAKGQVKLMDTLNELGIEPETDNSLLLMRELSSNGRNICRINGRTVTLSILKDISRHLVDIHGQHQHQSLLLVEHHGELLDKLGGNDFQQIKNKVNYIYDQWNKIRKKINKLSGIGKDGGRRIDFIAYQVDEIIKADLKIGQEEELRQEREILSNAEKIQRVIHNAYQDLYSGASSQSSVFDILGKTSNNFSEIGHLDSPLNTLSNSVESLIYQVEDLVIEIRNYRDEFEYDPARIDEIERRLEIINGLKRKYGNTIEEILKLCSEMQQELLELENSQELLHELYQEEKKIFQDLVCACYKLSEYRKKVARTFEKQILQQLSELGMDKSSFKVDIKSGDEIVDEQKLRELITDKGYDRVEFMISTNPGEPIKPLARIISGGEMSRIMLAFKTILAEIDEIPTLIFDEIDVGISGRIAHVVGEKMGTISRTRQVICVTHLPQIAAMADSHYRIEKVYTGHHTRTIVHKLDEKSTREEIAKMTGGKTLSKTSLEHAQELLCLAQDFKKGIV